MNIPYHRTIIISLINIRRLHPRVNNIRLAKRMTITGVSPYMLIRLATRRLNTIHTLLTRSLHTLVMRKVISSRYTTLTRQMILYLIRKMTTRVASNTRYLTLMTTRGTLHHILSSLRIVTTNGIRSNIRLANSANMIRNSSSPHLVNSNLLSLHLISIRHIKTSIRGSRLYPNRRDNNNNTKRNRTKRGSLIAKIGVTRRRNRIRHHDTTNNRRSLLNIRTLLRPNITLLNGNTITTSFVEISNLLSMIRLITRTKQCIGESRDGDLPSN